MTQRVFTKEFHANYRGDQRHVVGDGRLYGPNQLGEMFVAVGAEYDPAAGRTRVRFDLARRRSGGAA